ncbi:MAG: hypothetical protein AAB560_03070 [Patescibacteria group bacterium]
MIRITRRRLNSEAVAALPMILLVGGIIVEVGLAGMFIAFVLSNLGYGLRLANEALAAANSGVDDALVKIVRDKGYSGSYELAVGNRLVQVSVAKDFPVTGKHQITALGVALTRKKKVEAVAGVNETTGEVKIEYLKEIAL